MPSRRPSHLVIAAQGAGLAVAVGLIIRLAPSANWDFALFGVLLGLSALSDLTAAPTSNKVRISGSFLALVVAMVYLGGAPAALLGILTIVAGSIRWREAGHYFLNNLFTYAWFPLIAGQLFHVARDGFGLQPSEPSFYAAVFGLFILALVLNFVMIAGYGCYAERLSFRSRVGSALIPVLPSELAAAVMAVGVAYLYHQVGLGAIALFGVVLVTFQYLLGALLVSQQRAEELERRSKQLASFQVGMLGALLRTLDLRDRMTARHSAAVARYARAIASRAGMSQRDQELVHVAGLLHDIGKVVLPDHILKANVSLTDEDWMLIRRHPQQGARVVASVDGYGPIADIILAHHERIDGRGYPRRLTGDEIPAAARIISVADTYDVMTARDSYREPTSSFEAIQELQRVGGSQLDARFVEIFVELLEGKDLDFRHGVDADFEKELSLEARVEHLAAPSAERDSARFTS